MSSRTKLALTSKKPLGLSQMLSVCLCVCVCVCNCMLPSGPVRSRMGCRIRARTCELPLGPGSSPIGTWVPMGDVCSCSHTHSHRDLGPNGRCVFALAHTSPIGTWVPMGGVCSRSHTPPIGTWAKPTCKTNLSVTGRVAIYFNDLDDVQDGVDDGDQPLRLIPERERDGLHIWYQMKGCCSDYRLAKLYYPQQL